MSRVEFPAGVLVLAVLVFAPVLVVAAAAVAAAVAVVVAADPSAPGSVLDRTGGESVTAMKGRGLGVPSC